MFVDITWEKKQFIAALCHAQSSNPEWSLAEKGIEIIDEGNKNVFYGME